MANWLPYLSYFRWGFQALTINEYNGLHFECDTPGGACLQTGDQVLEYLSFANHTVNYACFGLGMVLLGFLAWGYYNLVVIKLRFTSLGFTGKKYAALIDSVRAQQPDVKQHSNDENGTAAAAAVGSSHSAVFPVSTSTAAEYKPVAQLEIEASEV